jgi:hypothetical protein
VENDRLLGTNGAVLSCWKEIANYLGKGVRTVQRWEQMYGLPVRRPNGLSRKSAVIAHTADLDAWLESNWLERNREPVRNIKSSTAPDESVYDLIQTIARLRSCHREILFETKGALVNLRVLCARLNQLESRPGDTRNLVLVARSKIQPEFNETIAGVSPSHSSLTLE